MVPEQFKPVDDGKLRTFATGATRDTAADKLDFDGFLSPLVLERFARYMHKHRELADGTMRASDNWQKGIPLDVYRKSAWRHFVDFWRRSRAGECEGQIEDDLCALLFNAQGYLHELKARQARATAAQAARDAA